MRRERLDRRSADRLLSSPGGLPGRLSEALGALRTLPTGTDRREQQTLAAMVDAARAHLGDPVATPARAVPLRGMRVRIAAVATGVFVLGSTSMAAAGVLPEPAQEAAARVLSKVGVSVPSPAPTIDEEFESPAVVATPTQAAKGKEISGVAKDPAVRGRDKGAAVSDRASDGKSKAGEVGRNLGRSTGNSRRRAPNR